MTPAGRALLVAITWTTCTAGQAQSSPTTHAEEPTQGRILTEHDFLVEIPRVFSASRLPQLPSDSPGAVTVIDRTMIRASGARDIAELFRLVPGFVVGNTSGGRSVVAYHGLSGQISQRMQVLLDGRSLYAPYLFGGVDWSTLPVSLDDIDRIEVLRGSNSAAYGANAFLGVANIVTRAVSQSRGTAVEFRQGSVQDVSASLGAAAGLVAWRLSAGTRRDAGMQGAFDDRRGRYASLRGEWQASSNDEVSISIGVNENRLGIGRSRSAGDPERFEETSTRFAQLRWRRSISDEHEISLAASVTVDGGSDSFSIPVTVNNALVIDYARRAQRQHLEYQHWLGVSDSLRLAWGVEARFDSLYAPQLFNTTTRQSAHAARSFLNAEWTPLRHWTLNAGGLVEHDSLSGTHFAPRLVANWKYASGQTLRAGYTGAFRTPSLFEQRSDWRYVYNGQTIDIRYLSRGGLRPERVGTTEVSWLGEVRDWGLIADVRAFDERIRGLISPQVYSLPAVAGVDLDSSAFDLRNADDARIRGIEYQLRWTPSPAQSWTIGHFVARRNGSQAYVSESVPAYGAHILGIFRFAGGRQLSLFYQTASPLRWIGEPETVAGWQRLDARIEQAFGWRGLRGSIAIVGQSLTGRQAEVRIGQQSERRGWLVLSLGF